MSKSIKISLLQCKISINHKKMSENITELVKNAVEQSPDIIVLPERWRPIPERDNFYESIDIERGSDYSLIKNLSKEYSISIISGGIWEKRNGTENHKPFITSYYFDDSGEEIGRQDKLHLYSYEPVVFQPGTSLNIFTHKKKSVKFSILICFDVAFYETPRLCVEEGAELLISPTLIRQDGIHNWNIYLQARALENRVPIAACNPVGDFYGRHYPGKSKIISFKTGYESPSELLIGESKSDIQDILTREINISFPNKIRKKRLGEKIDVNTISVIKKNSS